MSDEGEGMLPTLLSLSHPETLDLPIVLPRNGQSPVLTRTDRGLMQLARSGLLHGADDPISNETAAYCTIDMVLYVHCQLQARRHWK